MKMGKVIQISTNEFADTDRDQGYITVTALDDSGQIWHKTMFPTGDVWRLVDMTTEFNKGGE